jgi:hypothetical protein
MPESIAIDPLHGETHILSQNKEYRRNDKSDGTQEEEAAFQVRPRVERICARGRGLLKVFACAVSVIISCAIVNGLSGPFERPEIAEQEQKHQQSGHNGQKEVDERPGLHAAARRHGIWCSLYGDPIARISRGCGRGIIRQFAQGDIIYDNDRFVGARAGN